MKKIWKIVKRIILIILVCVFLMGLFVCGVRWYVRISLGKQVYSMDSVDGMEKRDCILVLGAGVYRDGSLSPVLEERMKTAVECYNKGLSDTVFVTGDHRVGEYDEVDHMVEYLVVNGVPEDRIQFDYNGFSTYESMYRAAKVYGFQTAYVVTQDFHLYRAMYIGNYWGMDCKGIQADCMNVGGNFEREIREYPATIKDFFACLQHQEVSE